MNKDELLGVAKLTELLARKEKEDAKSKVLWLLAIIGAVAAVVVAAYYIYKFFGWDFPLLFLTVPKSQTLISHYTH